MCEKKGSSMLVLGNFNSEDTIKIITKAELMGCKSICFWEIIHEEIPCWYKFDYLLYSETDYRQFKKILIAANISKTILTFKNPYNFIVNISFP